LLAGRLDYVINLKYATLIDMQRFGNTDKFFIHPNPISMEPVYIAFSKKSPYKKYLPYVNTKIQQMKADGTIEKWFKKYTEKAAFTHSK